MFKVKLIQKTRNENGDSKREFKSEKQIKKNKNYKNFINELSKAFTIPINKIILMALTEDEDEYPINDQDDLDSYIDEAKEFLIIYEIDSIQNTKFNFNILEQVNFPKKELTLKGKDNKFYNLMITNKQDEIIFKSNIINNKFDIQYSIKVNIKDFYEINKIFRNYNSINEIYSKYFNDIKEEQIDIYSSDNKIIVYFSDNDEVKISFILKSNEMEMDNIIRTPYDKMGDIDTKKNKLDNQKNENINLKKGLEKRRNDEEKNISELKEEIENLKKSIKSIAKLCDKIEDIDTLKNELDKKKIENDNLKKELEKRINDDEKNISELKEEIENLKKSITSSMNQKDLKDNKLEGIIKEINQVKEDNKKINIYIDNMAQIIDGKIIKFEKDEIKHYLTIKEKRNEFKIDNIKISNITKIENKEFKNLFFVIDTNISSKNLLFEKGNNYYELSLKKPLSKGQNLNNNFTIFINDPKIGEYNIFIYVREKPDGENLSSPLKITLNIFQDIERLIENFLNTENKCLDIKKVYQMYEELDEEFNLTSIFDNGKIIKKIIEYNCDRGKFNKWLEDNL